MRYCLRFIGERARAYGYAGQPYFTEIRTAEREAADCFESMRSAYPDIREYQVFQMGDGKVVASGPQT